ncbi:unnamed protein product [Moneuplotes crassus]|uniref:Calmodulin n=1 Tax=Euplotes crassus TaxID=5936 RepID=A0AAD2D5M3_EUPCR|nr:unnamed protein product [Moneuplotes crassus]
MDKLKKSPTETSKKVQIELVEKECLNRVFEWLSSQDPKKGEDEEDPKKKEELQKKITLNDLTRALRKMGCSPTKSEVKNMIWEVDDDLDEMISEEEFLTIYKRCISDETGLEPRKFFNLVQFLMYDKDFRGRVTVEETLQILFVRHGREQLDTEIEAIFGVDERQQDEEEKEITYQEYVEKVNERALQEQKKLLDDKRKGKLKGLQKED